VAVLDLAFLGVLAFSLLIGAWRGLVYEVLSVLGWALAFYLAQWFAPDVATLLPLQSVSEPVRYAAAFVLIFIVAVFTAGLLSVLIKKLIEAIGLRPVDRTLGAAFGLLRGDGGDQHDGLQKRRVVAGVARRRCVDLGAAGPQAGSAGTVREVPGLVWPLRSPFRGTQAVQFL
jgi:hypothetical protein